MKRLNGFKVLSVGLLAFAMASCGGSSDGGELEFNFTKDNLVGKSWFANEFMSEDYEQKDDLIVYSFKSSGDLERQEYGGREFKKVGTWTLDEKKLVITDKDFPGEESIEWFLQRGTNSTNLLLSASGGRKLSFSTSFAGVEDVTADAFIVSSIDVNGNVTRSIQCRVNGKDIKVAKLLLKDGTKMQLEKNKESVFVLKDEDIMKASDYPENADVKFYLGFDKNVKVKISDLNSVKPISSLENNRGYNQGEHSVTWKAINEEDIFYTIEILTEAGDILFRSKSILVVAGQEKKIIIDNNLAKEFGDLNALEVEKPYKLKITGMRCEEDVKTTSMHRSYNIQAKTDFTYAITW